MNYRACFDSKDSVLGNLIAAWREAAQKKCDSRFAKAKEVTDYLKRHYSEKSFNFYGLLRVHDRGLTHRELDRFKIHVEMPLVVQQNIEIAAMQTVA